MTLRLAELVAGLCVVSDLGKGLSDSQGLRSAALAQDLAVRLDIDHATRETLFWVSLLRFVGCTATATEMSRLGDEVLVSAAFASADTADLRDLAARAVGVTGRRPDRFLAFMARAPKVIHEHETTSCEVARSVALQLELPPDVVTALGQVFERYDGKGNPGVADVLHPAVALWQTAHQADLLSQDGADVPAELRRRAGTALEPDVARVVADLLVEVAVPEAGTVAAVLEREPLPHRYVEEADLDRALSAFPLLADGKSPYFRGHSYRVADLAGAAATAAGLAPEATVSVRRAGLVHDIGKVAISARVWNATRSLTDAEREQVQLHAYYTRRALVRVPSLTGLAELAGCHHERLDGSGYPQGTGTLTLPSAILAAADCFVTATETRPHRPRATAEEAAARLREAVADGTLPADAVDAVLRASTGDLSPAPNGSGDLTARERDVLDLVADGLTNTAIGSRLGISAKTVNAHLEHVYAKLGVSTRVGAVVHAQRRGWLT